jgi:hypothetical protein
MLVLMAQVYSAAVLLGLYMDLSEFGAAPAAKI